MQKCKISTLAGQLFCFSVLHRQVDAPSVGETEVEGGVAARLQLYIYRIRRPIKPDGGAAGQKTADRDVDSAAVKQLLCSITKLLEQIVEIVEKSIISSKNPPDAACQQVKIRLIFDMLNARNTS